MAGHTEQPSLAGAKTPSLERTAGSEAEVRVKRGWAETDDESGDESAAEDDTEFFSNARLEVLLMCRSKVWAQVASDSKKKTSAKNVAKWKTVYAHCVKADPSFQLRTIEQLKTAYKNRNKAYTKYRSVAGLSGQGQDARDRKTGRVIKRLPYFDLWDKYHANDPKVAPKVRSDVGLPDLPKKRKSPVKPTHVKSKKAKGAPEGTASVPVTEEVPPATDRRGNGTGFEGQPRASRTGEAPTEGGADGPIDIDTPPFKGASTSRAGKKREHPADERPGDDAYPMSDFKMESAEKPTPPSRKRNYRDSGDERLFELAEDIREEARQEQLELQKRAAELAAQRKEESEKFTAVLTNLSTSMAEANKQTRDGMQGILEVMREQKTENNQNQAAMRSVFERMLDQISK
ncbi:hypothetical protein KFL_001020120 [Klebsormidium nitens]|uniref:Myb/SANT-like domain-containing protein n=1 Tax=Klebsormidium nitens TaxID=105231 RepID=A0A1Y1HWJ9_KLENI|nr:hypothetical protein KFL_001020120 [Klebsormidium nitens]|eukprot:GAQ82162.1 hypothetical protein KFL_001020120 [Klebsormidium nitens]